MSRDHLASGKATDLPESTSDRGTRRQSIIGDSALLHWSGAGVLFGASVQLAGGIGVALAVLLIVLIFRARSAQRRDGHLHDALNGPVGTAVVLLISVLFFIEIIVFLVALNEWSEFQPLPGAIVCLAVLGLFHFGARYFYGRIVAGLMGRRASGDGDAARTVVSKLPQTDNRSRWTNDSLSFETVSAGKPVAESLAQADKFLSPAARLAFRGLILAIVGNAVISMLLWSLLDVPGTFNERGFVLLCVIGQVLPMTAALGIAIFNYWARLKTGWVTMVAAGFAVNAINIFALIPDNNSIRLADALRADELLFVPAITYLLVLTVFLLVAAAKTRNKAAATPRLLILRVFGFDRNTTSLFRKIALRWQNAGPVFTIVDRTFARLEFARGQRAVLFLALAPAILLLGMLGWDLNLSKTVFLALPNLVSFYLPLLIIFFAYRWTRLKYRFARNADGIRQRIAAELLKEGVVVRRHRQAKLFCFDDTWRNALADLVRASDVVLMDLRDFSNRNLGVAFELGHITDNFRLDRVVFLVDADTDQELFRQLVNDAWRQAIIESPNRRDPAPVVTVYETKDDGLGRDVSDILTLVGRAADRLCSGQPAAANIDADAHLAAQSSRLHRNVTLSWLVIVAGFGLGFLLDLDGVRVYSGTSVVWIGILLVLWTTRTRALMQRDGHCKNRFRGFPWTLAFTGILVGWVLVHVVFR